MKARTTSYVMTADVKSTYDMQQIELVRKTVATSNRLAKQRHAYACRRALFHGEPMPKAPVMYRVSLKGRLGKNNPNASKYAKRYCYHIAMADATRIDVYIHERN